MNKMTYEEARQSILSYCVEECGMIESCDFNVFNNCVEALAIKAIEKQIPKKPNSIFCPACGNMSIIDGEYGDRYNYCYVCGQAIDWKKENEDD